MENSLLFINKRPEVIKEFLANMQGTSFQIDVADSGILGMKMLREKEYKVVITGMLMAEYDGEKILTYLKEKHPNTVCMVYTTRINIGQIVFLTNKLKVFRIFLRPGDYKGEMLSAIEEGFLRYDLLKQEAEALSVKKVPKDTSEVVNAKERKIFAKVSLALLEGILGKKALDAFEVVSEKLKRIL